MNTPRVSIIIPVAKWNKYLDENIRHCFQLDYPDYEIIVLTDDSSAQKNEKVRLVSTGCITPPAKRNVGLQHASGEIIAFIDDDAFPDKNWLREAVLSFRDEKVAAVCGPGITPAEDSILQKASGFIYESQIVGSVYSYRHRPLGDVRIVDDYPTFNLIIRKRYLDELGGFRTNFWPGEDTALCLDITKKINKKIIYNPKVVVYHHRRPLFGPHLRQIRAYALHRGYFAKRFPETSFRLSYIIPSLFTLFLVIGWFTGYIFYTGFLVLYLSLVLISVIRLRGWRLKRLVFLGIIATHISYGIWFIKGLLTHRLKEENR